MPNDHTLTRLMAAAFAAEAHADDGCSCGPGCDCSAGSCGCGG